MPKCTTCAYLLFFALTLHVLVFLGIYLHLHCFCICFACARIVGWIILHVFWSSRPYLYKERWVPLMGMVAPANTIVKYIPSVSTIGKYHRRARSIAAQMRGHGAPRDAAYIHRWQHVALVTDATALVADWWSCNMAR